VTPTDADRLCLVSIRVVCRKLQKGKYAAQLIMELTAFVIDVIEVINVYQNFLTNAFVILPMFIILINTSHEM